jgi:hypothetical protein
MIKRRNLYRPKWHKTIKKGGEYVRIDIKNEYVHVFISKNNSAFLLIRYEKQ